MPYHMFLLEALFELFESIFAEARKQISAENKAVINQICDEKFVGNEEGKSVIENCVESLNGLSTKLEKCNVKIGKVFSASNF
ncbi:unnamed protein product [Meloidogyne enterolobii]|uniref:Uncharacterized protein n=1 Tax=Meloidogyne enterolobii TaxID=390850 RepID=A0ACB0XTV0_MELEN